MSWMRALLRSAVPALAVLLALALPADALALSWGSTVKITTSRNGIADEHALATTGGATAHLVYGDAKGGIKRVWYRRSTDGGATWGTPTQLSSAAAPYAGGATAAARGSKVDAAWLEQLASGYWVVRYARSTNGGGTWATARTLSPTSADANYVRLARDSADRVFVMWSNAATGAVRIRRSTDGGATFLGAATLGTTTNEPFEGTKIREGFGVLAAGSGVVYAAFYKTWNELILRRTTDGGASWTAPKTLSTSGTGYAPDIAASGSAAIVGFDLWATPNQYAAIRRTSDKGVSWRDPQPLSPMTGAVEFQPQLAVNGTTWRAVYEGALDASITRSAVYYRESADGGATWSTAQKVSTTARPYSIPCGVGYTGAAIVCWYDWKPDVLDSDVLVRRGALR